MLRGVPAFLGGVHLGSQNQHHGSVALSGARPFQKKVYPAEVSISDPSLGRRVSLRAQTSIPFWSSEAMRAVHRGGLLVAAAWGIH